MSPPPPPLVHVAAWIRSVGGVETLLRRHAATDERQGFDAWQIALFDKQAGPLPPRYAALRFSWRTTPAQMRRAMAREFEQRPGSLVVWHNAWGVAWFADQDRSSRRILYLADNETHFGAWLPQLVQLADGVCCLSPGSARAIARLLPGLPPERQAILPVPIEIPEAPSVARPPRREILIGCVGRLVRKQKRWDRLVPFLAELDRLGVAHRVEISGDGPLRSWLIRRLGGDARIHFTGWLDSAALWARLQTWDAAIFFSDHEGGPIALLEGMAAGVIPVYPAIGGSLGDEYVPQLDPRCYYPAGDARAAAQRLKAVMETPPPELAAMREKARALSRRHQGAAYETAFAEFAQRIATLPRISSVPAGQRPPRLGDHLPLGLITRFFPRMLWR